MLFEQLPHCRADAGKAFEAKAGKHYLATRDFIFFIFAGRGQLSVGRHLELLTKIQRIGRFWSNPGKLTIRLNDCKTWMKTVKKRKR